MSEGKDDKKGPRDEKVRSWVNLKWQSVNPASRSDHRPTESFEFELHLLEKSSHIYVSVISSSFSLNVTLFSLHKVNNVVQILISNVKLAEGPTRSFLLNSSESMREF